MLVILVIEEGRRYMVAIVPVGISQFAIVSVVLDNLLLGDLESTSVFKLSVGKSEDLSCLLASEWGLTEVSCNRWPHVLENHHVVLGHLCYVVFLQFNYT